MDPPPGSTNMYQDSLYLFREKKNRVQILQMVHHQTPRLNGSLHQFTKDIFSSTSSISTDSIVDVASSRGVDLWSV